MYKTVRHTNDTRTQVPVVADNFDQFLISLLPGAVSVDINGEGFGNTNGIGQLHKRTARKTRGNERLG